MSYEFRNDLFYVQIPKEAVMEVISDDDLKDEISLRELWEDVAHKLTDKEVSNVIDELDIWDNILDECNEATLIDYVEDRFDFVSKASDTEIMVQVRDRGLTLDGRTFYYKLIDHLMYKMNWNFKEAHNFAVEVIDDNAEINTGKL